MTLCEYKSYFYHPVTKKCYIGFTKTARAQACFGVKSTASAVLCYQAKIIFEKWFF